MGVKCVGKGVLSISTRIFVVLLGLWGGLWGGFLGGGVGGLSGGRAVGLPSAAVFTSTSLMSRAVTSARSSSPAAVRSSVPVACAKASVTT